MQVVDCEDISFIFQPSALSLELSSNITSFSVKAFN